MSDINKNSVFNVSETNFSDKVVLASEKNMVLVDFWAPWCGPCKQLTPLLEKIITKAKGRVLLAKINIDENKQIASQLRIQSIPSVFAFKNKQIVDAFQGVIPENQIIKFIEKNLGEKLEKDSKEFYNTIENMFAAKEFDKALERIEIFMSENSQDFKAMNLYISCLTHMGKFEDAKKFIKSLDEESLNSTVVKSSLQNLKIKEKNHVGPLLTEFKNNYQKNPNNINNILDLADKYFTENLYDEGFELLLNHYPKHRNDINKKILEFFEALGNENEKTKLYRKKFSSIMFS